MLSSDPYAEGTDPETTIRRSLWRYPTLYAVRADVLYHLFCSVGNGYEWEAGELVPIDYGMPWHDRRDDPVDPDDEVMQQIRADDNAKRRRNHDNIERWATDTGPMTKFVSGSGGPGWIFRADDLSSYQYLWAVPDDVTPDWRRVWEEARALFIPMYQAMSPKDIEAVRKQWEYSMAHPTGYRDSMLPFPLLTPTCEHCGQTADPWWDHTTSACLRCDPTRQVAHCRNEHHAMTVHGGYPPTPDQIRDWLADQPAGPLTDAVTAVLDRFEADGLPDWGPKPGSTAEAAYERAHFLFYGLANALQPAIARDTAPEED